MRASGNPFNGRPLDLTCEPSTTEQHGQCGQQRCVEQRCGNGGGFEPKGTVNTGEAGGDLTANLRELEP